MSRERMGEVESLSLPPLERARRVLFINRNKKGKKMTQEIDKEILDTLENGVKTSLQIMELMVVAIGRNNPEAANDIDELINTGKVRLVLQADVNGLELFAVGADNKVIGGPLLAYRRAERPTWVN